MLCNSEQIKNLIDFEIFIESPLKKSYRKLDIDNLEEVEDIEIEKKKSIIEKIDSILAAIKEEDKIYTSYCNKQIQINTENYNSYIKRMSVI